MTGPWDFVIIGGGATGLAWRSTRVAGYEVLLLEGDDFGKGTSSRSTKLVHGGVRYLEQGNISLVMEALKERGRLRQNAPHLVRDLAFVVPSYDWWESPFYGLGLKVYNVLSGKYKFGPSRHPLARGDDRAPARRSAPRASAAASIYYDGQFDDARLLINLAQTAAEHGATLLNYARVTGLTRDADGFIDGVDALDVETGESFHARAKVVINATGAFCDAVRKLADPAVGPDDRAEPGDSPRLRPLVPAGRPRDHDPAHERRPRHVRDPLARPHARRHDRRPARRPEPRAARDRGRDRLHPRNGPALSHPAADPRPTSSASSRASARSSARGTRRTPPRSRATTRSTSTARAC